MKRKIALLLTAVMVTGMFAGCGNSGSSSSGNTNESSTATASLLENADPDFKYDEPVTLSSYFEISPTIMSDFDQETVVNSLYYQRLKERTNISIDWKWFAANTTDDSIQKKSVAIASGDIPDFMIVNSSQLALLAKSDLINRDIGKIYDAYASDTLKEWTTGEGDAALESAKDKGDIIAIPLVDSSIDGADVLWIRRDWINKLGLEMPKTMEDLYNVMIAFRDQDPDGNGQADTLGMVFHNNFLSTGLGDATGVFNGFGAYPEIWIDDGNGKLEYGVEDADANKEALNYLAKMYQEGLIEQDFSSNDETKGTEPAAAGKAGIQYGQMWNANWPLNATVQNDLEADWVAIQMPSSTGEEIHPQINLKINGYVVVSKKCEHPEAVVRMLNFWCDAWSGDEYNDYLIQDGSGATQFPIHWVMLKTFYPLKNLNNHLAVVDALENDDDSKLNAEQVVSYEDCKKYLSGDRAESYGGMKIFGNDMSSLGVINEYHEADSFLMNAFTGAPTETMGQKLSTVNDKIMEYYTKVIMGIETTDTYDDFLKEVNALGLEKMTEEVNEWNANRE